MANTLDDTLKVVPAQLSFLSIYNPTLATSDENFKEQILFYFSRLAYERRKTDKNDAFVESRLGEDEHEKLRQIGLAQGMVNFAKNFSNGGKIDNIETEKSRIVTHELEPNWWIIGSIELTKIPNSQLQTSAKAAKESSQPSIDYSSREVSPPALLIQQVLRAHTIFQLHNGQSLTSLYRHLPRARFSGLLERYWTRFALQWDVMLHGMPIVEVFGGMHLSAGGELGVGVGEEEWGAGEREVLEDFVHRTDGLTDLLVARFGEASDAELNPNIKEKSGENLEPWMGVGREPVSSDGIIFSGVGALSRKSMRDVARWVETIYAQGESAYAVKDSPSSDRRKRKKRTPRSNKAEDPKPEPVDPPPGIPRPIVAAADRSLDAATAKAESKQQASAKSKTTKAKSPPAAVEQETWKKYLFLGYGTAWGVSDPDVAPAEVPIDAMQARINAHIARENAGHFLIGLQGDPDQDPEDETSGSDTGAEWNRRIMIRTIHVTPPEESTPKALTPQPDSLPDPSPKFELPQPTLTPRSESYKSDITGPSSRVRVLIYAHRPFIYALLFDTSTATLMMPSFYQHIHTFLSPLRPLLLRRTGLAVAALRRQRTSEAPDSGRSSSPPAQSRTYEVVYDAQSLGVCANVPVIDEVGVSRPDALNLHSAAMELVATVRSDEVERRVKTGRGWWIGWARVGGDESKEEEAGESSNVAERSGSREVLLIRRAVDMEKGKGRAVSGWGLMGGGAESRLEGTDMGIGFDARKYVEGIMGFGR